MNKLSVAFSALKELGIQKITLFALYKLGLKTGLFRSHKPPEKITLPVGTADLSEFIFQWSALFPADTTSLLNQANAIINAHTQEDE